MNLSDNAGDDRFRKAPERHDGVEPIAELRRKQPVDRLSIVGLPLRLAETEWPAPARPRAAQVVR